MVLPILVEWEHRRGTQLVVDGLPGVWSYSHVSDVRQIPASVRTVWVAAVDADAKRFIRTHTYGMIEALVERIVVIPNREETLIMTAKKTPAPVEPDTGLVFEDAEVPETNRSRGRQPGRFDKIVASLEVGSTKGKKFRASADDLKKIRRELTASGLACDPPVTVTMTTVKTDDDNSVFVIIGARKKITQDRTKVDADAPVDAKTE